MVSTGHSGDRLTLIPPTENTKHAFSLVILVPIAKNIKRILTEKRVGFFYSVKEQNWKFLPLSLRSSMYFHYVHAVKEIEKAIAFSG